MTDTLDKPQPEPQSWQSDAEREGLPRTNIHDTGAPLLDRDAVLDKSLPNHAKEK